MRRCAQVKEFESGMVVNPVTIHPQATLGSVGAGADEAEHGISGIPVVRSGAGRVQLPSPVEVADARPGKLVGILTNRDVRFATDLAPDRGRAG